MKHLLKALIRVYSVAISPLSGPHCRFHPTCSAYATQALEAHGALKGSILALRRVLKCHALYRGPLIDPVPPGPNHVPNSSLSD